MDHQENQTLHRWWIILLCVFPSLITICVCVYFKADLQLALITLIASLGIIPSLAILLLRFNIMIDGKGITYSISILFNISKKTIEWSQISSIKVSPLNMLKEFGGMGIRYNPSTKFWGYVFQGNEAIEIEKKDGMKIKISTINGDKVGSIILNYFENK